MSPELDLEEFAYELPPECIAQQPAPDRDAARLLVLDRATGALEHGGIRDLSRFLQPGDLLVVNTTRVLPARLRGHKASGGAAEALILGAVPGTSDRYRALVRSTGRLRTGLKFHFGSGPESLRQPSSALSVTSAQLRRRNR